MFEIALLSGEVATSSSNPGRVISPNALGSCPSRFALSNAAATDASLGRPDPAPVDAKGSTSNI